MQFGQITPPSKHAVVSCIFVSLCSPWNSMNLNSESASSGYSSTAGTNDTSNMTSFRHKERSMPTGAWRWETERVAGMTPSCVLTP